MENNNPLSPHIQIYRWHISSLVSISHRITGIINIIGITSICLLASLVVFGENNYEKINLFLTSSIGKFTDSECETEIGNLTHVAVRSILLSKIFFVSLVIFNSSFV